MARNAAIVDGRFQLRRIAGVGGMGTVFQATDLQTGATVALKRLRKPSEQMAARFAREAQVLAQLEHLHIVQYITHGVTDTGEPYLVMEWIAGETLAARLQRGRLEIEEAVALVRRLADALEAAHARGVIHRDIKPGNILLPDGDVTRVKLLDFGIARREDATTMVTQTGSIVGTPGYMAPEQARGERGALDARVDVFSLGCVFFECLTGQPAFVGVHLMSVLAKLLMEDAPRVRELRPETPAALDALVARMLAKSPVERPANAAAVGRALEHLGDPVAQAPSPEPPHQQETGAASITGAEIRVVSVVALLPGSVSQPSASEVTAPAAWAPRGLLAEIRRVTEPLGARVEELANGVILAMLIGAGNVRDRAALAARCALLIRQRDPDTPIALLTGRGDPTRPSPVGEVLDQAAALLAEARAPAEGGPLAAIHLDELTPALLDERFEVVREGGRTLLRGEREIGGEPRTLLGKPSPYLGRDRELRRLVQIIEDSIEDRRAQAVLVTAPAGMGKSRLRFELLRELRKSHPEILIAVGRGDSIGTGSAFAMVGVALRGALGIEPGDPPEVQREKLSYAVGLFLEPKARRRVAEFLGEMVGISFPDEHSPKLRAARQNPAIMADQIQAAFLDFARAVTDFLPVVLVLEDLHWGDMPSIKLVSVVMRELRDRPLVVLAFARPTLHEHFPDLWAGLDLFELRLGALPPRAAEALVHSALGEGVDAATVAAVVERAEGNAFYLEELIRSVADGHGAALPASVLGMLEARLQALDPEARRLLRAASVLGEVLWRGAALALIGGDQGGAAGRDLFQELVAREILVRRIKPRFAGEEEYAFRHALIQQAAYAMLTDADRALGHRLAGAWLEQAGEQDPAVLAEHFERGEQPGRAAGFYAQAAEHALRAGDYAAAIAGAERGIACGAADELRAALRALEAQACCLLGHYAESYRCADDALLTAAAGSRSYCQAIGWALISAMMLGRRAALPPLLARLFDVLEPHPDALSSIAMAYQFTVLALCFAGLREGAATALARMEQVIAPAEGHNGSALAWAEMARAHWRRYVDRDPWGALAHDREAARLFTRDGHRSYTLFAEIYVARDQELLGAFAAAEEVFQRVLAPSGASSLVLSSGPYFRCLLLVQQRRLEEAHALTAAIASEALARDDRIIGLGARLLMAEVSLLAGRTEEAERETLSIGPVEGFPPYLQAWTHGLLAELDLRRGQVDAALAHLEQAQNLTRATGIYIQSRQDMLPLLRAEALHARGDHAAAHEALREARGDLLARASRIADPILRRSFLEVIPANARTLELARAWLGEP